MIGLINDTHNVLMVLISLLENILRIHAICLRQFAMVLSMWEDHVRSSEIMTPRSRTCDFVVMGFPLGSRKFANSREFLPKWICSNLSPLKTALFI